MYPTGPVDGDGFDAGIPATTEEPAAPAPRRGRRALKIALVTVACALVVAVPSAIALFMTLGRAASDELARVVPANVDAYATVLLDPSLSQKRNLQSLFHRFPQTHSDSQIEKQVHEGLDESLKPLGIDFQHDVEPWLGSQIAVAGTVDEKHGAMAVLLRSTDDKAAAAALDKAKAGPQGSGLRWSFASHRGVVITHADLTGSSSGFSSVAYAVFDHVAVIASDQSLLESVIDTDHGAANLAAQAAYKDAMSRVPADHVAAAYVNLGRLLGTMKKALLPELQDLPAQARSSLDDLDAYRSLGAALSLQSSSVSLDSVVVTDPSKMSATMRDALGAPARRPQALDWVPASSLGVLATTASPGRQSMPAVGLIGALTVIGRQTDDSGSTPDLTSPSASQPDPLQQLGLTGSDGILAHLTGDAAISIGPGGGTDLPVSILAVVGTDDGQRVDRFLHGLGALLGAGAGGAHWRTVTEDGIAVNVLEAPELGGLAPAYAVADGFAVIGSDEATVAQAIAAHNGGGITAAPAFRGSPAGAATGGLFFVDLQRTFAAVDEALSPDDRADFDENKDDLRPLRTFTVTSSGDTRHQAVHMVLTFGG